MDEAEKYQVEVTEPAALRYQRRILTYLSDFFSTERASEIDGNIFSTVQTLKQHPKRGRQEELLEDVRGDFRYILFRETKNFEIKIIHLNDEERHTVFVTDFFPTRMSPKKIFED